MGKKLQQAFFIIRLKYLPKFFSSLRKFRYSIQGMKVGDGTTLPALQVTWPHQVLIGNNCHLESNITYKYDGIWSKGPSIRIADNVFIGSGCEFNIRKEIEIGKDTLIASGCKFIDHDHGISTSALMRTQHGPEMAIKLGQDVWLGCNVIVLKGVEIADGAIVAAGAVVTKSILSREIWGGVPARKIGERK
jgi:acetyltransferase-like isoleucine patch superfamily enzyme